MKHASSGRWSVRNPIHAALALTLLLAVGCGREPAARSRLIGQGVVDSKGAALTVSSSSSSSTTSPSAAANVEIPDGALTQPTSLTLAEVAPLEDPELFNAPEVLGPAYRLTPTGEHFQQKVKLTINCASKTRPLVASTNLRLSRLKDGAWEPLESATWDPTACLAEGLAGETGTFGLVPENPMQSVDEVTGTDFVVGSVRISSTQPVQASIAVAADAIRMNLRAADTGKKKTDITIRGLRPNGDVFVYDGTYDKKLQGVSDADGAYTYSQALSDEWRLVWVQPVPATILLTATGGGCSSLGTWNGTTKTCTMTHNVTQAVSITGGGVTLNCAGYTINAGQSAVCVGIAASSVTVGNCVLRQCDVGVGVPTGKTGATINYGDFLSGITTDGVNIAAAGGTIYRNKFASSAYGVHVTVSSSSYAPSVSFNNFGTATTRKLHSTVFMNPDNGSKGNYWSRPCPGTTWFIAGTDTNTTNIIDRGPYGFPATTLDTTAPTGCAADADGDLHVATTWWGDDYCDANTGLNTNNWTSAACAGAPNGCRDVDGDSRYTGCDRYSTISQDYCDANTGLNTNNWTSAACAGAPNGCRDVDGDSRYTGCDRYSTISQDYCDANTGLNTNNWTSAACAGAPNGCRDVDGDSRYTGCDRYSTISQDYCDGDTNNWTSSACAYGSTGCRNLDGDGRYTGCDRYYTISQDYCDENANNWTQAACAGTPNGCRDDDSDNHYTGCDRYYSIAFDECDAATGLNTNNWTAVACGGAPSGCRDVDGDSHYTACDRYQTVSQDLCDVDTPVGRNSWTQTACSGGCQDHDADSWYVGCDRYALPQHGPDCKDDASSCTSDCTNSDGDSTADCLDRCYDADHDEYGDGEARIVGAGSVSVAGCTTDGTTHNCALGDTNCLGLDCADYDFKTYPGAAPNDSATACMKDTDGDDWGDSNPNYGITAGTDCNDQDSAVHASLYGHADVDGDGHGVYYSSLLCTDGALPSGYVTLDDDCNDGNTNEWLSCATCGDPEADGWYSGCDRYLGINGPDNCPAVSNPTQRDSNSDGLGDACDFTTDHDGDGYVAALDPDDYDPNSHTGAVEICDGIDNDGDNLIDEGTGCEVCP